MKWLLYDEHIWKHFFKMLVVFDTNAKSLDFVWLSIKKYRYGADSFLLSST